ncbi:MAG: 3'-5' exonuclease [Candidatus Micrarchaeota archaeon]
MILSEKYSNSGNLKFMSVHQSKGRESKIVIVLDVVKDKYGFPCELQNPDILAPAIDSNPINQEQEERRLFYVAATRAMDTLIFYTMDCSKSKFICEVKNHLKEIKLSY